MKRILLASDGSEHAIIGGRYAIEWAHLTGAGLIGLHISDPGCLPDGRKVEAVVETGSLEDKDLSEFARSAAKSALAETMKWAEDAGLDCHLIVERGNVVEMILYHSDMRDMTVLGALGQHSNPGSLLGSTVRGVVNGSIRPVLVARAPYRPIKRVLIAYERTAGAAAALSWAGRWASAAGWQLLVVHGTDYEPAGELVMEQASQFLASYGVMAETRVLIPAGSTHAVFEVSQEYDPDMILVGSRGRGAVARAILGSISADVLEQSRCAVMVFH